jgi:hypothetical protein
MDNYPNNGPGVENPTHPCYNQTNPEVGLFVGADVQMQRPIGGATISNPPAGNVWPVGNKSVSEIETSTYTLVGWEHLPSFMGVLNEGQGALGEAWKYYSFQNEFLNYIDITPEEFFDPNPQPLIASTPNQEIPPNTDPSIVVPVCPNFNTIVFPLNSRPGGNEGDVTSLKDGFSQKGAVLGQNIPNPANLTTTIPFYIPFTAKIGKLEIFEVGTGRVLKQFDILEPGKGAVEFETRQLPVGIFGYRLLVDGQPIGYLKMSVTH